MKNIKISRLFAAALFVAAFTFFGCAQNEEETSTKYIYVLPIDADDALIGDWVDDTACHYEISQTAFDNHGSWGDSYAGNNLVVQKFSETSGTIFIKYTRAMNPDFSYTNTAPDVGNWYAISYKDLTDSSIQIAGAYKENGKSSCATLKEAVKEFTKGHGYFDTYSTCTK